MAVISGTITGVKLLTATHGGTGARASALLTVHFGTYSGAADTAIISAIPTAIQNTTRNGKTVTLRSGSCVAAGRDTNNQAVYTGALTVSTNDLTTELANAAGTELTSSTATVSPVSVIVAYDEA